jgi:hypothetical protein
MIALVCGCQSVNKKQSGTDDKTNQDAPKLTRPSVRKIWVAPHIEDDGRTYRDGHFIYILQKDTTWSQ